jgi:rRNA maturation endonuclease Nob1
MTKRIRNSVHLSDPCSICGGRWTVITLSVSERMRRRIGRAWAVRCSGCRREALAITPKQERDGQPKPVDKPVDPQMRMRFGR